ncbi:hypothetical protein WJX74_009574 [Apatococcus lobatus]|uniref:GCF C-terminal domain-containing protein n=1 Tax=Apatococcus lobatus TaxID=904363 RepID=A0AAW1QWD0_9CHLO
MKNRKFRKKATPLDDAEDEEPTGMAVLPTQKQKPKQPKVSKPSRTGLLSFDEDAKKRDTYTQVSNTGEYSAERMKELQKNTVRFPGGPPAPEPSEPSAPSGGFKLSGSFKPAGSETSSAIRIWITAFKSLGPPSHTQPPAAPEDDSNLGIPNAEIIRQAKEKRERLRSAHLAPDYLPLGGAERLTSQRPEPEGPKAAEQDSASDEDDLDMRMRFVGRDAPKPVLPAGDGDAQAWDRDAEEAEEAWAAAQIRSGAGAAPHMPKAQQAPSAAGRSQSAAGPGNRGAAVQVVAAGDEVMRSLQQGMEQLQASRRNAQQQLDRTDGNLEESMRQISVLEGDAAKASDRYTFLQDMRGYVADLCEMLDHKSPIIEALQDSMSELQEHFAESYQSRVESDEAEEMEPCSAAVAAALDVLARGGASAAATAAAENAAKEAEERQAGASGPVQLDELGRDMNVMARREAEERAQSRNAYLQQSLPLLGSREAQIGEDTTDASDGEVSHLASKKREILEAARAVFADADAEFSSLGAVKRKLEAWKAQQPGTYRDAYMSLSVPALLAPFVRLELLQWDPLAPGNGFDSHEWHQELFDYGQPANGQIPAAGDADEDLIPKLVRQLVLPVAKRALSARWNPFSRRQTAAAKGVLELLLVYLPPEGSDVRASFLEGLQDVLTGVRERLAAAAAGTRLPPWPLAATAASSRAAVFVAARFSKVLRLLASIAAFSGVLAPQELQQLAFDNIIRKQVLPFIRASIGNPLLATSRAHRLLQQFPAAWFSGGQLKPAAPLLEVVQAIASQLQGQRKSTGQAGKDAAQQLVGLLRLLGAPDPAADLASTFRLNVKA